MKRCIRCDTEHNLSERGLCPSCEFIVTAGLPTPAPVAPTSADDVCEWCDGKGCGNCNDEIYYREEAAAKKDAAVKQNPLLWDTSTRDFEDSPIPTKRTSADGASRTEPGKFITVPELIAFLEDASVDQSVRLLGIKVWLRDYGALNAKQHEEIKRLAASNAALQAQVDATLAELNNEHHAYKVDTAKKLLSNAPNVGETAADLCSVIGCGKVATHVSDVPYRDGVQAHYCDEHTLYERPIETAAETIDRKAWGKLGDKLDGSYYDANAQPTTARKLSKGVKLTETQETVLQVAVRRGGQMRGDDPALIFRGAAQSLQACVKRDWLTFNYEYNRYTITPAGVAALAARESEAR